MKLHEVKNKKDARHFLDVARVIYEDDDQWVCPLDAEVEAVFDPRQNTFFSHGEATRWYMTDDSGKLIGRVAAFINEKKAYTFKQPTGGMGFFESINDREVAFALFDTARAWLEDRKMEAMDGPINFGENDSFWGLLVEGFTQPGYGMQYNPPYYKDFFEAYGFYPYFNMYSNHLNVENGLKPRFLRIAQRVLNNPDYSFEHFDVKRKERYLNALLDVYNAAWKYHENFQPMTYDALSKSFAKAKPIMDQEMIWYVFKNNDPAAFLIMYPDVNMILKHFDGKMNLWNKLRFLYMKKRHYMTRARLVIMGVKPKYQKLGLESGIFASLNEVMKHKPWVKELELSWVGDFNPKMRVIHDAVGSVPAKKHITYRKLFYKEEEQHSKIIR
ncbi:MAG: hypothetical protein R6T91_07425 [Bacteroidales bacterium]